MTKIVLEFDKTVTRLAGNPFGKAEYEKQCEGKIDFQEEIIFVFPDNIRKLGSSFIQGFFEEVVKQIGIAGIEEKVMIESSNPNMKQEILSNLYAL